MDSDKKSDRLDDLEGRLYAQEHRSLAILGNFLQMWFGKEPLSKESKLGIWRSGAWMLAGVILPTSAAGTSVLAFAVAVLTLCLQCNQNRISTKQTDLAEQQNVLAEQQNKLTQQQNTLAAQQNKLVAEQNSLIVQQNSIAESAKFADRIHQLQAELFKLPQGEHIPIALDREVISWAHSLIPLDRDQISGRLLSKDRGRLLIALVNSPADCSTTIAKANFFNADLLNARFEAESPNLATAHLRFARLDGANLRNADLRESYLLQATLVEAVLISACLADADASGADFTRCDLRGADLRHTLLNDAILTDARLEGAIVDSEKWLEFQRTKRNPPKSLDWTKWRIGTDSDKQFRLISAD